MNEYIRWIFIRKDVVGYFFMIWGIRLKELLGVGLEGMFLELVKVVNICIRRKVLFI